MKHSWTQPSYPDGKYNRLYQAQRTINLHNDLVKLDKLEPITDLTEAAKYLNKFQLGK